MKILSIRQPWASLIVEGLKDIENRDWHTAYRGPVLIHAALKWDEEDVEAIKRRLDVGLDWPLSMPTGGVIGIADMIDCVEWHDSKWFVGPYGFVLRNVRRLPFTPVRGHLGLRRPTDDLLQRLAL